MAVPDGWLATVQKALPQSALTLAKPDTAIRFMHRQWKNGTVFLLFNESSQAVDNRVTLRGNGKSVEVWDPQTGDSTAATDVKVGGAGAVTLPLQLAPYATEVLVLH
jgi:hypothetical protein